MTEKRTKRLNWLLLAALLLAPAVVIEQINPVAVYRRNHRVLSDSDLVYYAKPPQRGEIWSAATLGRHAGLVVKEKSLCAWSLCGPDQQRMIVYYDIPSTQCSEAIGVSTTFTFQRKYEIEKQEVCIPRILKQYYFK